MDLAVRFLRNIAFRVDKSLRVSISEWALVVDNMASSCAHARMAFDHFAFNLNNFRSFLLDCPCADVRALFAKICKSVFVQTVSKDQQRPEVVDAVRQRLAGCILNCLNQVCL